MNIQIFGKSKCFDTKKAERYFKERKIKYQLVDLPKYGMSKGELQSVIKSIGSIEQLIDEKSKHSDAQLVKYLSSNEAKIEKLMENPQIIKTPVVRNGRVATIGYQPDIWKTWE